MIDSLLLTRQIEDKVNKYELCILGQKETIGSTRTKAKFRYWGVGVGACQAKFWKADHDSERSIP